MQSSPSSKIAGLVASSTSQVPIRASRKSEWLQSVLAHLYDPDPGVENEIVVLATGIDQYLQEIFHHLAYRSGCDLVTAQDFRLLCGILGIFDSCDSAKERGDADEIAGIFSGLPSQLHFREFHARLCGHFSLRERNAKPNVRLPITEETEHIEREIRLRCPRVRRRKCVSFDLARNSLPERRRISKLASILKLDNLHHCAGESDEEKLISVADSDQGGAAIQQAEIENASLRELVEDLRAALQTSDARCLALEVALLRERGAWPSEGKGEELNGAKVEEQPAVSSHVLRGTRDLLRELELIRASRDGQLEEAMRFNQRLEAELRASNEESRWLEGAVLRLQRENGRMRRRAEEARSALARGLDRVREIQEQARLVPSLQARVRELEADRERVRCQCNCGANRDELDGPDFMTPEPHHITLLRHSPTGRDESCNKVEDGFLRAVEGRASSDEEEEGSGREEGQCCLVEVKRMLNRLHCCSKGCQNSAARQLLISQTCFHANPHSGISATMELRGCGPKSHTHLEENESDQEKSWQEEVEMLRMEMRMMETERVRLSLLEEKLTDALTLLLQLRAKNISRRALGNIFMDTLDVCSKAGHGPSHSLQVIDTLCQQMLTCELLREGAGSKMDAGTQCGVTNPLLISC